MQQLNTAWHKASPAEKNALKNCVHTNPKGDVTRIDSIKDHPELEKFIRTFADGKTYIGVGAWNGSPGVGSDNAQVEPLPRAPYIPFPQADPIPRAPPPTATKTS